MSRIEQLIEELCPGGVEWNELSEVSRILNGYSFKSDKYVENGIRVIRISDVQKGKISDKDLKYYDIALVDELRNFILKEGDLVMSLTGNVGRVAMLSKQHLPAGLNQRVACVRPKNNRVLVRYLFHYLNQDCFEKEAMNNSTGGGQKNLSTTWLNKFMIPIPPLPIQQEIVTILNTFTSLDDSLQAELDARRKQYEHYRNQLLNFEGKDVEWKMFEDCFEMRNGYTPSKSKPEYWENGTIPWFRMEDIRANGKILSKSIQQISKQAIKGGKLFPANSIIIATSATIGEHALITTEYLSNQRFTCFYPKKKFTEKINVMYMYYYSFILSEWCKNNTNVSGFASVDMTRFRKLLIPIPPLFEQERIVGILDKFDALVSSTGSATGGLPAEIDARRKQYEYYREKLLTFEPK